MIRLLPIILATLIFISCADNTGDKGPNMCPVDGANLYIKCADGRKNVFGLGYGEKLRVRDHGTFTLKAANNFCEGNKPSEINFWLRGGHFKVQGSKEWGVKIETSWQTEHKACSRVNHDDLVDYDTLIIKTLPLIEPVPKENEDLLRLCRN